MSPGTCKQFKFSKQCANLKSITQRDDDTFPKKYKNKAQKSPR